MNKDEISKQLNTGPDINDIRQVVVTREFEENKGKKALMLIEPYPFLIIGIIKKVMSDYVFVDTEVTNVAELDDELFRVHVDEIKVFYIEKDGKPIPDIRVVSDD